MAQLSSQPGSLQPGDGQLGHGQSDLPLTSTCERARLTNSFAPRYTDGAAADSTNGTPHEWRASK
jgi:hypothetical protein